MNEQIKNIQDFWLLKNGSLYLLVKGEDNIIRPVIVPKKTGELIHRKYEKQVLPKQPRITPVEG
jgi:hypothetical protein